MHPAEFCNTSVYPRDGTARLLEARRTPIALGSLLSSKRRSAPRGLPHPLGIAPSGTTDADSSEAGNTDSSHSHHSSIGTTAVAAPGVYRIHFAASPTRLLEQTTARQLLAAMTDAMKQGTAIRIASALAGAEWVIGGKTGTGAAGNSLSMNRTDGAPV